MTIRGLIANIAEENSPKKNIFKLTSTLFINSTENPLKKKITKLTSTPLLKPNFLAHIVITKPKKKVIWMLTSDQFMKVSDFLALIVNTRQRGLFPSKHT